MKTGLLKEQGGDSVVKALNYLSQTPYVTLDRLCNLSGPQFSMCKIQLIIFPFSQPLLPLLVLLVYVDCKVPRTDCLLLCVCTVPSKHRLEALLWNIKKQQQQQIKEWETLHQCSRITPEICIFHSWVSSGTNLVSHTELNICGVEDNH